MKRPGEMVRVGMETGKIVKIVVALPGLNERR